MAVLDSMPDPATIGAMRGLVDYYYWKGLAVARKWPKKDQQPQTPGEAYNNARFKVVAVATGAISTETKELWKGTIQGTGTTWVDAFRAQALGLGWWDVHS